MYKLGGVIKVNGQYVEKRCSRCSEVKPASSFYKCSRPYGGGIRPECKVCNSQSKKAMYDPVKQRIKNLKYKYGISEAKYLELMDKQNSKCAICKGPPCYRDYLSVDHCHVTGQVRGLLCGLCNTALGKFKDNVNNLKTAIKYLGGNRD